MTFLILTTSGYSNIIDFFKLDVNFKKNIFDKEYILKNFVEFFVFLFISIFWPIYLFCRLFCFFNEKRLRKINNANVIRFELKTSDLIERIDKPEIEKREIVYDPLNAAPTIPFGHLNFAWIEFCSQLDPIDELWIFDVTWNSPAGWSERYAGYAAVRNHDISSVFYTR